MESASPEEVDDLQRGGFAEEGEIERIIRWRLEQLQDAGYETQRALAIAQETEIDLHLAINLVSQGCPQTLADRILL